MNKYASMSDDEFFDYIEQKYGEGWQPGDIEADKELYAEYIARIATGT